MGLITLLAGCEFDLGLAGGEYSCGFMGEGCPTAVALQLDPSGANFLKGDTVTITARSDSGHAVSDWTATGSSRFVRDGALTSSTSSTNFVRLHALAVGSSTVEAQSTNSAHHVTGYFTAADSSVIAQIWFWQFGSDSVRITTGTHLTIACSLQDGFKRVYLAKPTSWTSADTTIAGIAPDVAARSCSGVLRARKVGHTTIAANFLGVSGTLRVYVTP